MVREMIDIKGNLILLFGLLLLLPMSLAAESHNAGSSEPWYQFEVLVFRRIDRGAGSTEGWELDPGAPDRKHSVRLSRGAPLQANKPIPFRALPAEEKSLSEAWRIMRGSRNYRPLYHLAWRQPVSHPDRAKPVYFSLQPKSGSGLDGQLPILEGTVKFGIRRYLHLETDILLRSAIDDQQDFDDYGPRYRNYRMQEKRRMRSGKLHYLDHPLIGVLAIAKRYKMPEPEITEPQSTETLPATSDVEIPSAPGSN
jgi:hypothetical protein